MLLKYVSLEFIGVTCFTARLGSVLQPDFTVNEFTAATGIFVHNVIYIV